MPEPPLPVPPGAGRYARTVVSPEGHILPEAQWQLLTDHLETVAQVSAATGAKFDCEDWARLAGLWHDLGKYNPDFQQLLHEAAAGKPKRRVDHSTAGAVHACRAIGGLPKAPVDLHLLLSAPIAAHHSNLPEGMSELAARFEERSALYDEALRHAPPGIVRRNLKLRLPTRLASSGGDFTLRLEFMIRMLLSTVVDADRLDAERVNDGAKGGDVGQLRRFAKMVELVSQVDNYIDTSIVGRDQRSADGSWVEVNGYRQEVLASCRRAAEMDPGAFKLDVVTGGGKTLSSLSFALRHAVRHGLDRVIFVIPYTSIIEQTARIYRDALGPLADNVIEHHSSISAGDDESGYSPGVERARRATENWDAPIIVTTSVQFFESLMACSASRCRKLHNVANSVIVLDEAQTLPPRLLNPTVWILNELVEGYRASVVLSTATQPALDRPFPEVRNARSIVSEATTKPKPRVRVEWDIEHAAEWPSLASELSAREQVLCITHLRNDARSLLREIDERLGNTETFHLSAAMCAAHRANQLRRIRDLLAAGRPCRVVSTQLVEAGVDLDFPVVYRSLGGIDSLIQAAGRANREGRLGERGGLLRVFLAPSTPPRGAPRRAADAAQMRVRTAALEERNFDLFSPQEARDYFRDYYSKFDDRDGGVTVQREQFNFKSTAEQFRFIPDVQSSVVVPYNSDQVLGLVEEIRELGPSRTRYRKLQRFIVGIYSNELNALEQAGALQSLFEEADPGKQVYVLTNHSLYDARLGLVRSAVAADSEHYII